MSTKEKVYQKLNELNIEYQITDHEAVFTIEDINKLSLRSKGKIAKNLFLRDYKGKRHFLIVMDNNKKVDLKKLQNQLGCSPLSFASEKRLQKYLQLCKGSVTPLGVINDKDTCVEVVFDRDLLKDNILGVHPNDNTATVWILFSDLLKVIEHNGNLLTYVDI